MAEPSPDPLVGAILQGRYKILSRIAAGGMGVVYRGERLQFGRAVAIKFLHAPLAADKEFLRRFEQEAKAMSRLGHPHCVSVIDFGIEDGAPYMVLDYVTGKNLRETMDASLLAPARALHIMRQLLAGLAHAHGQGIVHRDIKPANIMLSEATGTGDHVRILDFGLAKLRDAAGPDVSQAQIAVGTPSYMSPEQASGEKVDARSDVYSAGILLFELLAGRKPFIADEAFELLEMHRFTRAPRLRDVAPERALSAELESALAKALAKKPEDRFQSAALFLEAIGAVPEAGRLTTLPPGAIPLPFAQTQSMPAADTIATPAQIAPAQPPTPAQPPPLPEPPFKFAPDLTEPAPEPFDVASMVAPVPAPVHTLKPTARAATAPTAKPAPSPPPPSRLESEPPVAPGGGGRVVFLLVLLLGFGGLAYWRLTRHPDKAPAKPVKQSVAVADGGAAAPLATGGMSEAPVDGALAVIPPAEPDAAPVAIAVTQPDAAAPDAALAAAPAEDAGADPSLATLPPDERDEPVAAVPEAAHVEEAQVDAPEPVKPEPSAHPVTSVDDARALITAGKKLEAIVGLQRLRRQSPKSAYIPYLLGNLYFERLWFTQGIEAYGGAVANDSSYRGRATLNHNIIRALGSDKTRGKAAALIRKLGRPSLPYLRRAAAADADTAVRARAAALVKAIDPPRKPKRKH